MRALLCWPLSIAIGVGVAALSWEFAGLRFAAVGFGVVYAVGVWLFLKARYDLKSRVRSWKSPSLWSGAFSGLLTGTMLLVANTAEMDGSPLPIVLGLVATALVGMGAGIGLTLENLDAAAERDRTAADPADD